jgi:hypothetical protein
LKGGAPLDSSKYGARYEIPEYRGVKNDPMIPKAQKKIFAQNNADKPPYVPKANDPVLNLQLYQQKPPPPKPKPDAYPNPAVFYPNYVPNPFNPIEYANFMRHTQFGNSHGSGSSFGGPIFKEYNINIGGVSGSHVKTSMIFEDSLPLKDVRGSYATLGERKTMYEFIRAIMFSKGDGEDLPIDDSNYNLLSHLKFMDMNPYNPSRTSNNPYRSLPYGYLIFRSCYPIRHNERDATTMCANNSTGINVRIYRMTEGAYKVNKAGQNAEDHDVWRDMAFYDYVKDQIVKKKICPNFMIMYGYNITLDSKIDFESINSIDRHKSAKADYNEQKRKTSAFYPNPMNFNAQMVRADQLAHNRENANKMKGIVKQTVPSNLSRYPLAGKVGDPNIDPNINPNFVSIDNTPQGAVRNAMMSQQAKKQLENELTTYRGKALVCLTEAANYSLIGWARKSYRTKGYVSTMNNYGVHPEHVWKSVLFQLMAALYTMQIKGILIRDFKLNRNVFIKDIESHNKSTTYWKYKIDGIEYYVPNYGYLVLIDTNYRDFDKDFDCNTETDPNRSRKIDGWMVKTKLTPAEIMRDIFEAFKSSIDPDNFDQDFVADDGIKPPEEIMSLLSSIKNDADAGTDVVISNYIRKHMVSFLHNRVGTLLTVDESQNIMRGAVKEFRNGELVVMVDTNGKERYVIHVGTDNDISRIITKDRLDENANIIEKDVPASSLIKYSTVSSDAPKQSFDTDGTSLNTEPSETYTISRI